MPPFNPEITKRFAHLDWGQVDPVHWAPGADTNRVVINFQEIWGPQNKRENPAIRELEEDWEYGNYDFDPVLGQIFASNVTVVVRSLGEDEQPIDYLVPPSELDSLTKQNRLHPRPLTMARAARNKVYVGPSRENFDRCRSYRHRSTKPAPREKSWMLTDQQKRANRPREHIIPPWRTEIA